MGSASADETTTMTVNVTDQDGDPLGDIEVTAQWDDGEGTDTTRSNGNALIDVPATATVHVTLEDPAGLVVQNVEKRVEDPTQRVDIQMAPPGSVEFTVSDVDGDEPIEDVRLRLRHTEVGKYDDGELVASVESNAAGVVTVSDIEQRSYELTTSRAGYLDTEREVDLDSSTVTQEIELESRNVEVEFSVTDSYLQSPLRDATIRVDGSSAGSTQSDGTQITRLPVNDNYEITVEKDGYDAVTERLILAEESRVFEAEIRRTPAVHIQPLQTSVVTGQPTQVTITNAYDDPVSDATVSLNGDPVGTTDAQGMVQFNVTTAGENTVAVESEGLESSMTIQGFNPDAAPAASDQSDVADEETDSFGPGFGVGIAIVSILGLALIVTRRSVSE